MKLLEALKLVAAARRRQSTVQLRLAAGFEPLHLPTFLVAHHAQRFSDARLEVHTGLYGDIVGTLRAATGQEVVVVVLEWADLDARLGLRATSRWSGPAVLDIVEAVDGVLARIGEAIREIKSAMVVVVPPTLGLLCPSLGSLGRSGTLELQLEAALATWKIRVSELRGVSFLSLDDSHIDGGDARSMLETGFPYSIKHADALCERIVAAAYPSTPKKGLITDLDGTLWSGLVGEVGPAEVAWTLGERAQHHGIYQLFLQQLADHGVLLAVASKNEQPRVDDALGRRDLYVDGQQLFPAIASWGPKSDSVARILRAWNVGPSDVVFVDDTPHELAEVAASYPDLVCLEFPRDPAAVVGVLGRLRGLFGGGTVTAEDLSRAESIRSNVAFSDDLASNTNDRRFLDSLNGVVGFSWGPDVDLERAVQLLNKTNQFNVNGRRVEMAEVRGYISDPGHAVLAVSYQDRYGSLGTVGIVVGRAEGSRFVVQSWAMSCRAFCRRIEHHTLAALHNRFGSVAIDFARTTRNAPLRAFLRDLHLLDDEETRVILVPDEVIDTLTEQFIHRIAEGPE